jgi:hypothetical protein
MTRNKRGSFHPHSSHLGGYGFLRNLSKHEQSQRFPPIKDEKEGGPPGTPGQGTPGQGLLSRVLRLHNPCYLPGWR